MIGVSGVCLPSGAMINPKKRLQLRIRQFLPSLSPSTYDAVILESAALHALRVCRLAEDVDVLETAVVLVPAPPKKKTKLHNLQ